MVVRMVIVAVAVAVVVVVVVAVAVERRLQSGVRAQIWEVCPDLMAPPLSIISKPPDRRTAGQIDGWVDKPTDILTDR